MKLAKSYKNKNMGNKPLEIQEKTAPKRHWKICTKYGVRNSY